MDTGEYCREIEAHLCRRNQGHLVRIAGPAFEQVCGWAAQGVPLKIVLRGIDQYCERHQARGPRRRPVRIEFCEADILDLFDAWRRALGVGAGRVAERGVDADGGAEPDGGPGVAGEAASDAGEGDSAGLPGAEARRKPSLAAHVERAIARLATARSRPNRSAALDTPLEAVIRDLEAVLARARQARGDARLRLIDDLAALDRRLMDAVRASLDAGAADALQREAGVELAPFGSRLTPEARARALAAAFDRLLRESLALPVIAYE